MNCIKVVSIIVYTIFFVKYIVKFFAAKFENQMNCRLGIVYTVYCIISKVNFPRSVKFTSDLTLFF